MKRGSRCTRPVLRVGGHVARCFPKRLLVSAIVCASARVYFSCRVNQLFPYLFIAPRNLACHCLPWKNVSGDDENLSGDTHSSGVTEHRWNLGINTHHNIDVFFHFSFSLFFFFKETTIFIAITRTSLTSEHTLYMPADHGRTRVCLAFTISKRARDDKERRDRETLSSRIQKLRNRIPVL